MGRPKKYFTEEERKAAIRENKRRYYQKNKDDNEFKAKNKEYAKRYAQEHPEVVKKRQKSWRERHPEYDDEYGAKYRLTQKGRAVELVKRYNKEDKKHNRGECTLTADWIVQHILSKSCHYCDKSDWSKLGCDRIDNNLPHTPDNVVPCCWECNRKKRLTPYDEFMRMIGKIKMGIFSPISP